MSFDLFNVFNELLTLPATYKTNYTGVAFTNVSNLIVGRSALIYSNSLS